MQNNQIPDGWRKLGDLPPGTVFETQDGTCGVKSELCYEDTPNAQSECISLDDGKYLHFKSGNDELVRRMQVIPLTLCEVSTVSAECVEYAKAYDALAIYGMRLAYVLATREAPNGMTMTFTGEDGQRYEFVARRANGKDTATAILELQAENAALQAMLDNLSQSPATKLQKAKAAS